MSSPCCNLFGPLLDMLKCMLISTCDELILFVYIRAFASQVSIIIVGQPKPGITDGWCLAANHQLIWLISCNAMWCDIISKYKR